MKIMLLAIRHKKRPVSTLLLSFPHISSSLSCYLTSSDHTSQEQLLQFFGTVLPAALNPSSQSSPDLVALCNIYYPQQTGELGFQWPHVKNGQLFDYCAEIIQKEPNEANPCYPFHCCLPGHCSTFDKVSPYSPTGSWWHC